MHRQNSIQPYNRHYTHTHTGFLDYLEPKEDGTVQGSLKKKGFDVMITYSLGTFSASSICDQNESSSFKIPSCKARKQNTYA